MILNTFSRLVKMETDLSIEAAIINNGSGKLKIFVCFFHPFNNNLMVSHIGHALL